MQAREGGWRPGRGGGRAAQVAKQECSCGTPDSKPPPFLPLLPERCEGFPRSLLNTQLCFTGKHSGKGTDLMSVSECQGHRSKVPQTGRLKQQNSMLRVLAAGSLRSGCRQGWFLRRAGGENLFWSSPPHPLLLLSVFRIPWFVATSP